MEKIVNIRYSGRSPIQKVEIIKKAKIRANHKGISEFAHRNIRSDGIIKGFKIGDKKVPKKDIHYRLSQRGQNILDLLMLPGHQFGEISNLKINALCLGG